MLMQDFDGQLAFITGGASGAGFGQAQVFGRAGSRIVIADLRADAVAKAVADLQAQGITAHGIVLDITDRAAYAAALLFNTAGVNSFGPVELTTYGDFDWLIGVNLGGVINGMVTFVPRMIASGKPGHIVSCSSLGGLSGSALCAPYSAAKAAVINLMESYAQGLAKHEIGVSVICPANIKSNIAEATKTRPDSLGPSGYRADEATIESLHSIHRHGMEPVELAQWTMKGMANGDLYIIPYPEAKEQLRGHFDKIVEAVLPMDADPEGAKKRVEALMEWASQGAKVFSKA
jgi:NAD(P)-dependent dehydrogenase (short-subunit alcohol dehydrogenase family)